MEQSVDKSVRVSLIDKRDARALLDPEVLSHVEKVIPQEYIQNDEAHGIPHAKYVIRRAMRFGALSGIDPQHCFIAAAYHDAMHHIDRKRHEWLSAEFFMNDEFMKKHLTPEERIMIKEAIEDHRSSLEGAPRSILGRILSSADRTTDTNVAIARTDKYMQRHFPDESLDQRIERSFNYIMEKYGPQGYARTYFDDPEFTQMKENLCNILKDKNYYKKVFLMASGYTTTTD